MADLLFKDSRNRQHQVCIQFYETSCGPACVAMAERIYKHLNRSDEARMRKLSRKYPGGWTVGGGSFPNNVSSVLNAIGVKAYKSTNVTHQNVKAYLEHYVTPSTPAVLGLQWQAGGKHFVLCARRDPDDTYLFYDPFYGVVEGKGKQLPWYYAHGGAATPHSGGTGWFDGWIVLTHK